MNKHHRQKKHKTIDWESQFRFKFLNTNRQRLQFFLFWTHNYLVLNKYTTNIPTVKPQYSDATITLLSSSNTPYYNFRFYDVFPTTLSTFVMSATDSPDTIITADATFRYSYFDVEKLF